MQHRNKLYFASNSNDCSDDSSGKLWKSNDSDSDDITNGDEDDVIFYDIEYSSHKGKNATPDNSILGQKLFVSNVLIEKILNLGKIVDFE